MTDSSAAEVPGTTAPKPSLLGQRVRRREDPRLLRGLATYTDDLPAQGDLHAVFVRSDFAAGRVTRIATEAARDLPGVRDVVTMDALRGRIGSMPPSRTPPGMRRDPAPLLADGAVRYVGHPIAIVLADDRYRARDGAAAVEVDIEPRPAVTDPDAALAPGAPRVYDALPDNVCQRLEVGDADIDRIFAGAHGTLELRLEHPRVAPAALEPRAVVAGWDAGREKLTLWSSTQVPHVLKQEVAACLGIPEFRVRAVAPEVGGGFGSKTSVYPEECLLGWLARHWRRRVRWTETRGENLLCTTHGRGQTATAEVAYDRDGRVLGLRGHLLQEVGAFPGGNMGLLPGLYVASTTGCYAIAAAHWTYTGVYTNTMAVDAYRGVGRVEPTYVIERALDAVAARLGLDPAEVRRRNFIPADAFPYTTPGRLQYDSGDYGATLDRALERFGYAPARSAQADARTAGRLVGIGIAASTEVCSFGPSAGGDPEGTSGYWESAAVRVEPSGNVTVLTGLSPHGQGTETVFVQMVADRLGVDPESVTVVSGDTDAVPHGVGTHGSRGATVGGTALHMALSKIVAKAGRIAAHHLDVTADRIAFEAGVFRVAGAERTLGFREVARAAHVWSVPIPGEEPGLEALAVFEPGGMTFPNSVHVCQVEVDPDTGAIELQRYLAVDDCGVQLNPMLVDGQRLGGIVQGLGQVLGEVLRYDANGQPQGASLMQYAMPRASWFPRIELESTCTRTDVNPLGAKGVGEAGTITAPACLVNAVLDALAPRGVTHLDMPLTPERVWRALRGAGDAEGTQ